MPQRAFGSGIIAVAMVALVSGCAAFSAAPAVSSPGASARDLSGTWNGQFWILGGFYYPDEGTLLLEIQEDGTFTVKMTPTAAANNMAVVFLRKSGAARLRCGGSSSWR